MSRSSLIVSAAAFVAGAFLFWLFFCRGESAELRRQIDDALHADSVARVEIDSLRAANDSLAVSVATMRAQLGSALDEVDSLIARPPRVIRVMVPAEGGGPAVPVDVVLASVHNNLVRSCSAASVLCRATTDSLSLLAERRDTVANRERARADSFAVRIARFTVPRDPPKWAAAVCTGYGGVYADGNVYHGPSALIGVRRDFNPLFFLR